MAAINTNCPACGTPHAKKLSIIYEEGRVSTHSSLQMVSTTHTSSPSAMITHGSSAGVQQSEASKSAAPPSVPPLHTSAKTAKVITLVATVGLSFLIPVIGVLSGWGFLASLGIGAAILIVGLGLVMSQGEAATEEELAEHIKQHPAAYAAVEEWKKTFACTSCGHRFVPDAITQAPAIGT